MNKDELEKYIDECIAEYNNTQGDLKGYSCAICKNNGYIARKAYNLGTPVMVYTQCSCLAKRKAIIARENSNIGGLLKEYNLDNFNTTENWQKNMLAKANSFINNKGTFFYVGGQVGCGKTRLCVSILNKLIDNGEYNFKTELWTELVRKLKSLIFNENAYDKVFASLINCNVLFIDDFLKFANNEKDVEIAFSIINARYNANKITIISSEKTGEELIKLDEALGSRIYQYAGEYFLSIEKDINKNIRFKE